MLYLFFWVHCCFVSLACPRRIASGSVLYSQETFTQVQNTRNTPPQLSLLGTELPRRCCFNLYVGCDLMPLMWYVRLMRPNTKKKTKTTHLNKLACEWPSSIKMDAFYLGLTRQRVWECVTTYTQSWESLPPLQTVWAGRRRIPRTTHSYTGRTGRTAPETIHTHLHITTLRSKCQPSPVVAGECLPKLTF